MPKKTIKSVILLIIMVISISSFISTINLNDSQLLSNTPNNKTISKSPISSNSPPRIGIMLSETEIYRNNTLYFNITPYDAEDILTDLTWNSTIIKVGNPDTPLSNSISDEINRSHTFSTGLQDEFLGEYYIEANISDNDGDISVSRAYFTVLNNAPIILNYSIEFPESEDNELLRISGIMDIEVNVSDIESLLEDLSMEIYAIPVGEDESGMISFEVEVGVESNFKCTASIPANKPIGAYKLYLTVYETSIGNVYSPNLIYDFELINNPPDATKIEYSINGLTPSSIEYLRFQEFENLLFQINVTDVDPEGIKLIRLCLIDPTGEWMNFSFFNDINHEDCDNKNFTIRARDLKAGQWYVYVYVTDGDETEVGTGVGGVISFDIVPDTFSGFLPWLMLIFGSLAGLLIGAFALGYRYISLKREYEAYMLNQGVFPSERKSITEKDKKTNNVKKKSEKIKQQKIPIKEEARDPEEIEEQDIPHDETQKKRKLIRRIK
ncbi:MAG: hypothetical protein ACTSWY_01865 [Promethearchaeota archaeon]